MKSMKELYFKYFGKTRTKEYYPPMALRPYIVHYMIYENATHDLENNPFRALPNGRTELFFHLNGSQVEFHDNKSRFQLSSFLAGIFRLDYPMKIKISCPSHCFKSLSITFTGKGINGLLDVCIFELTNRIIDVESFWGQEGDKLISQLSLAQTDQNRIHILNNFFLARLYKKKATDQREFLKIIEFLENKYGRITVDELARYLDLSYKSIYRKFYNNIGMCPKNYLRIIRFNRACRLLTQFPNINWGELVYRCGYYDQAHFIKEFKTIMKESPSHFMKTSGGFFYLNRPYCFK
jgi:AraC-like DNA-binding protein